MHRSTLILWAALGCGADPDTSGATAAQPASTAPADPQDVSVAALADAIGAGTAGLILDVRTPEEFAQGHVPGATLLPVSALQARLGELEPHKAGAIHVICHSGGRSARAAKQLRAQGYRAINVLGGTQAWIQAGHPVE